MPDPIGSSPSPNACFTPADDAAAASASSSAAPGTLQCSGPTASDNPAVKTLVGKLAVAAGDSSAAHGAPYLAPDQVLRCHRIADLPFNAETLQVQHQFLVTADKAAGAGHCGDGVPGHGAVDLPLSSMCINDHTKEIDAAGVECEPVAADADCVNRELEMGKPIGRWFPPVNDCHTFVADVIAACPPPSPAGGAEGASSVSTDVH